MRALDLFCGAGGASMGLHRAGFEVTGVDIVPQPRYPFRFVQADALTVPLDGFDFIWASPPCQRYSTQTACRDRHPDLIAIVRQRLQEAGVPFALENVPAAPLRAPIRLCGSSFGLDLRRHRHVETNWRMMGPACAHGWQRPRFRSLDFSMVQRGRLASVVGVHGHINYPREWALRCAAMGIDWMTVAELSQAVPPVYAEWVARRLPDPPEPRG